MDENTPKPPLDPQMSPLKSALIGLSATHGDLGVLDYGNVLVRRNWTKMRQVRLVAGGTAGEDLHMGPLVGPGLLTAVALGDNSMPPCSRLICRVLREVSLGDHRPGTIVLAQANKDLFNFALACERSLDGDCEARIKIIVVDDYKSQEVTTSDCLDKPRNTCGVVLVAKIVGAMAQSGLDIDEIQQFYRRNLKDTIVTFPMMDLGQVDSETKVGDYLLAHVTQDAKLGSSTPFVVLLNFSRKVSKMEQFHGARLFLDCLKLVGTAQRLYVGTFFDYDDTEEQFYATLLRSKSEQVLQYLDYKQSTLGWPDSLPIDSEVTTDKVVASCLKKVGLRPPEIKGPQLSPRALKTMKTCIQFVCDALSSCENQLNIIDKERSVGNVGTRFKIAAEAVGRKLKHDKLVVTHPCTLFKQLSVVVETAIGGLMGSIYGVLLEGAAGAFAGVEEIGRGTWIGALCGAASAVDKCCPLDAKTTTMLHPIAQCVEKVTTGLAGPPSTDNTTDGDYYGMEHMEVRSGVMFALGLGVTAAEEAAQATRIGFHRFPDAGAHAVGIWMRALYEGIKLCNPNLV